MTPALYRLVIGQIFLHACMTAFRLAMPLYLLQQGASAAAIGLVVAQFYVANLFCAIPVGKLADRAGLQPPWRLGVAMALAACALCVLLPNLWGLGLAALLVGGAAGIAQIAAQQHATRSITSRAQRNEIFGWIMLAPPAGNFLGPLFVGVLLDHAGLTPADYHSLVAACAFIALLALISWWLVRALGSDVPAAASAASSTGNRWELLRDAGLRRVLWLNVTTSTCTDAFLLLMPILGHAVGLSSSVIGLTMGTYAVAAAVMRPLLPHLTRWASERQLTLWGNVLTGAAFLAQPFMTSAAGFIICSLLLGLSTGGLQPFLMTALTHSVPGDRQGQALGLRLLTVSTCHVTSPLVFGALGAVVGISAMFGASAAVAAVGGALTLRTFAKH